MAEKKTGERAESKKTDGTVCARCGTVVEETPLTWVCAVENGERRYFCSSCARDNIRAIEGRLDSSWWWLPEQRQGAETL